MKQTPWSASWRTLIIAILAFAMLTAACGGSETNSADENDSADETAEGTADGGSDSRDGATSEESAAVLRIGAIPDQEPERLQRTYDLLSDYLAAELDVEVEYVPVTDYQGAVTAFRVGDLDLAWFGGLTGVQARLEVDGANAVAQRDIDEAFTSVFIARADSGIGPISDVAGLAVLADRSFTFGSESSTSGRLMPQSFLAEAGLDIDSSFDGAPGFSGSHDATIEVVAAGSFEVGALNSEVWDSRVEAGDVDPGEVIEIFRTPPYYDYHWVSQPDLDNRFGDGFQNKVVEVLTSLDASNPDHAAILELFGAGSFIVTENDNYAAIEAVGRETGLIRS